MATLLQNSEAWIEPTFVYSSSFSRETSAPRRNAGDGGGLDEDDELRDLEDQSSPERQTEETIPSGLLPTPEKEDEAPGRSGRICQLEKGPRGERRADRRQRGRLRPRSRKSDGKHPERGSSVPHNFRRAALLRGLPVPRRPVVPAGGPPGQLPPQRGTLHGVDRADLPLGPGRAALEAPGRRVPLEPDPARAPRRDGEERPPPAVHVPVPAGTRGGHGGGEHGTRGEAEGRPHVSWGEEDPGGDRRGVLRGGSAAAGSATGGSTAGSAAGAAGRMREGGAHARLVEVLEAAHRHYLLEESRRRADDGDLSSAGYWSQDGGLSEGEASEGGGSNRGRNARRRYGRRHNKPSRRGDGRPGRDGDAAEESAEWPWPSRLGVLPEEAPTDEGNGGNGSPFDGKLPSPDHAEPGLLRGRSGGRGAIVPGDVGRLLERGGVEDVLGSQLGDLFESEDEDEPDDAADPSQVDESLEVQSRGRFSTGTYYSRWDIDDSYLDDGEEMGGEGDEEARPETQPPQALDGRQSPREGRE
ncbi:hypothetical protein THAOC_09277, partial [Thalassiosira oceanica]